MGSWATAGRSSSTLIRSTWRSAATKSSPISVSNPTFSKVRPNFTLPHSPLSPPSCERFVMRQLSSLVPLHCAIASAKLVSELPTETTSSTLGRFANYLSPI